MYTLSVLLVGFLFLIPFGLGRYADLYARDFPNNEPGGIGRRAASIDDQADYLARSAHFRRSGRLLARSPGVGRPRGPKKTKEQFKCPNCQQSIDVESTPDEQQPEKQKVSCPKCGAWLRRPVKSAVGTDWKTFYVPQNNAAPQRAEQKKPAAQPKVESPASKPIVLKLDKPKKDAKGRWASHTPEAEKYMTFAEVLCPSCKQKSHANVASSRRQDRFATCENPSCKKELTKPASGGEWKVAPPGMSRD